MLKKLGLVVVLAAALATLVATSVASGAGAAYGIKLKSAKVVGKQVQVSVEITGGFTMAPDKIGKKKKAGQGHYHIFVDGKYAGAGAAATGKTGKPFAADFVLSAGSHKITVQLANNDHSPVGKASSAITVTK